MAGWVEVFAGLLYWAMLAASTVGPGTIIVMAKSGADYKLELCWAVIVASFVAFTLQEAAARLFIVGGLDFGAAIRFHFGKNGKTPIISYVVAAGIYLGNLALECAQFVGALSALYVIYKDEAVFRVFMSMIFGLIVAGILLFGQVDTISKGLGVVVLLMVVTFGIGASQAVNDAESGFTEELLKGLFVPSVPPGSAEVALSMIATTALPMNVFLASSLANGFSLRDMRRGVAFSTFIAGLLSILIVVVGSGVNVEEGQDFDVQSLASTLEDNVGVSALALFVFGLFAASFSSALTIALGSAIAVQSLLSVQTSFNSNRAGETTSERPASEAHISGLLNDTQNTGNGALSTAFSSSSTDINSGKLPLSGTLNLGQGNLSESLLGASASSRSVAGSSAQDNNVHTSWPAAPRSAAETFSQVFETHIEHVKMLWREDGPRFRGIFLGTLAVSAIVASAGISTVDVVLFSQIVGGLLLPCLAICLLIVSSQDKFMAERPQSACETLSLVVTCGVTVFLAGIVLIPYFGDAEQEVVFAISAGLMVVVMVPISIYSMWRSSENKRREASRQASIAASDRIVQNSTPTSNPVGTTYVQEQAAI